MTQYMKVVDQWGVGHIMALLLLILLSEIQFTQVSYELIFLLRHKWMYSDA